MASDVVVPGAKTGGLVRKIVSGASRTGPWAKNWSQRGREIEDILGRNLGKTFKGVDAWDATTGTVVSIKSMDLHAKSYKEAKTLESRVHGYVDELAHYKGGSGRTAAGGRVDIETGQIQERVLRLGIPEGASQEQMDVLTRATGYAGDRGVRLEWYIID